MKKLFASLPTLSLLLSPAAATAIRLVPMLQSPPSRRRRS